MNASSGVFLAEPSMPEGCVNPCRMPFAVAFLHIGGHLADARAALRASPVFFSIFQCPLRDDLRAWVAGIARTLLFHAFRTLCAWVATRRGRLNADERTRSLRRVDCQLSVKLTIVASIRASLRA